MKPRHIILITGFFVSLMTLSAATVYQYMTGRKPLHIVADFTKHEKPVSVTTEACSSEKPIANLGGAKTAALKKLNVYQQACHSHVTDTMMVFVGFPTSQASAARQSAVVAGMLKDFAAHGVRPLVVAEPADYDTGATLDFAKISAGQYNQWLDAYFGMLKTAGITDTQMGIWTPFPEANLPYWNNNQPNFFAPNVNLYISALRKHFPTTQTSILLNSATYDTSDFNWANGEYDSLLPYIKGIAPGSINYVGLQGFPWIPASGGRGSILNAAEFLNPDLITEVADFLKVKNVWYNTGTFSDKYALDPARKNSLTVTQRRTVLATINTQAQILQKKGYKVSINLFAQDKSRTPEETNWSYWDGSDPFGSPATPAFTQFVAQLRQEKIDFWLFDQ